MTTEIERKFLTRKPPMEIVNILKNDGFEVETMVIEQVYIPTSKRWVTRIRKIINGSQTRHVLTMKARISGKKFSVTEIETPITQDQYRAIEQIEQAVALRKRRWVAHRPDDMSEVWFVDVFENVNLVLIEVELTTEDTEFTRYDFLGKEVTGKKRYNNAHIFQTLNPKT